MTSEVVVHLAPTGTAHFSMCEADVFDAERLTITATADHYTVKVYKPGSWLDATATDAQGYPRYHFESALGKARAA